MNLIGKIVRDKVSSPPRQILIAFVSNPRHCDRPLKNNRESIIECLQQLFEDIQEIHIDQTASLKDWYLDALDIRFWNECIARLLNKDLPVPIRPRRDTRVNISVNPRRSRRQRKNKKPSNKPQSSPPKRRENRGAREPHFRGLNTVTIRAFQKLGLEPGASLEEIDQAYCRLSRIYHPDLHNRSADADGRSTRTGLTIEETTKHMQVLNDVREYLRNL